MEFDPPLSSATISERDMKKANLSGEKGASVITFTDEGGGKWSKSITKIPKYSSWSCKEQVTVPTELWVLSGKAIIVSNIGLYTARRGKRISLTGLKDVRIVSSGTSSSAPDLSPVLEAGCRDGEDCHNWSVHDGQMFADGVKDGTGRAPNEQMYCRMYGADYRS